MISPVEIIKRSFKALFLEPKFMGLYLIPYVVVLIAVVHILLAFQTLNPLVTVQTFINVWKDWIVWIIVYAVAFLVLFTIVQAAIILKAGAFARGKAMGMGEAFIKGIGYFPRLFVAGLLAGLLIIGGSMVLLALAISFMAHIGATIGATVVLGILLWIVYTAYLNVRFALYAQACVLEDKSWIECLKQSWGATKGNFWPIFEMVLLFGIISVVIGLIPVVGSFVATLFLGPAIIIAFTFLLLEIRGMEKLKKVIALKPRRGETLVRAEGVVKGFPGVWEHLILDHVNLDVKAGEVHAVLGENGAGKTVLANVLSGFYSLTEGRIYVKGKLAAIKSPKDALELGIGMIHQEFTLARPLTVAENVALGLSTSNFSFPLSKVEKKLEELSERYGLKVDPKAKIEELSAGEQQRVEILKVLYHEPEVLILDEPTSVLTPQESKSLFKVLRRMAAEGKGVVFIAHKLEEVLEVADRITVLRLGKMVGTRKTSKTNRRELVRMMMGGEISLPKRKPAKVGKKALEVKDLHVLGERGVPAVKGISLAVREGEILGIAGIAGNGQSELVGAITGLRKVVKGKVFIFGKDITNRSPRKIADMSVAHIPEERRRIGTAEGMTVAENLIMKDYRRSPFSKRSFLNPSFITQHSEKMVSEYDILVPDLWTTETRILSGGNIQRLILARETWWGPRLIVATHPTYGLDLKAIKHTHELFLQLKKKRTAILLVSEDLEEIFHLSDRIAVIFEGKIVGTMDASKARVEKIGLMMAGSKSKSKTKAIKAGK